MKPIHKILLITGTITALNYSLGFDLRFTIINSVWLIPTLWDFKKK